jgi:hypothetical protein
MASSSNRHDLEVSTKAATTGLAHLSPDNAAMTRARDSSQFCNVA